MQDPRSEVRKRIRGLYAIADATVSGDPMMYAADLLLAGCRLIQLRCKDLPEDDVKLVAGDIQRMCEAEGATFIVNDYPHIAAEVGADGVHLGQTDMGLADARRIVGLKKIIGRSTNDPMQIYTAIASADYVAFGPVWETRNAGRPKEVRGENGIRAARAIIPTDVPLVAIGGITPERIGALRAIGVDAWAVIGAIARAEDRDAAVKAFLKA